MQRRLIATALAAALAIATAAAPAASATTAHHKGGGKKCHLSASQARHLGTSYVTSLHVKHTGCSAGKKVTKAFHVCRHKNGGPAGHCNKAVKGYHCSERRYDKLPHVQYDGTVTCKHGSKLVKSTYTQNI
jgi:hypothetical protein